MKTYIVTGANGFVGKHLIAELVKYGYSVLAINGPGNTIQSEDTKVTLLNIDLKDIEQVNGIDFTNIKGVIHLAGLAAVGPSFDGPMGYINTNIGIEVNLFEAALKQKCFPKFLIISSGSLYDPKDKLPLIETSRVDPGSPYAVSKLGQEQMAQYYGQRGFEYVIARPFNHVGPGQNEGFIVPDLTKQIVSVEKGNGKNIKVGNLEAQRDYTDVRDIVRAYRLLVESGKSGEIYNICSNKPLSGNDLLSKLIDLSSSKPELISDPTKFRPTDSPVIYGSYDKLKKDTGWEPEIDIDTTLKDVLEDWRTRI